MKKALRNFSALLIGAFILVTPLVPATVSAVEVFEDACSRSRTSDSTVCKTAQQTENPLFGPQGILTKATHLLSIVVAIAAVIMIMVGGIRFITSGDNPQNVTKARETILYAVVGLIIAASAQVIVRVFFYNI